MTVTHEQCARAAEERRRCTARFNDLAREVTRLGIAKKNILEIERFKSAIAYQKLSGGEVRAQSQRGVIDDPIQQFWGDAVKSIDTVDKNILECVSST